MKIRHILWTAAVLSVLLGAILGMPIRPVGAASVQAHAGTSLSPLEGPYHQYIPIVGRSFSGPVQPGQELTDALIGKYAGTTVTMFGPFTGDDIGKFENSVLSFEQKTGIDIQYEGSNEFESTVADRIQAGAPDIIDFPQPGLLGTFVKAGSVLDLSGIINPAWLQQNYKQSWLDMATLPGPDGPITAGVWNRAVAKSLVWYPKKAFDAAGYQVPQTWDELMALSAQMAASGSTPWCIGIESGAATGWPMTDWIEDTMLRTTSLANYDRWVRGDLKFDSPEVRRAIGYVTDIWFNDSYVYGGRDSIATRFFGDIPMFDSPPNCWLHRQGSFITGFFPPDKVAGEDYDFFYLPPIDAEWGTPVLGAGDIYAAFNDRLEVRAVIQYFSTGESVKGWVEAGGVISPHNDLDLDWYPVTATREIAEMVLTATSIRFDGSDVMPSEVGTGSFWIEMTKYVAGTISLDTALARIDDSWPD